MFTYTNVFDNEIKMLAGAYFSFLYFLTFHVKVQYLLILISHENSFHRTILLVQGNSAEAFALSLVILLGTTFFGDIFSFSFWISLTIFFNGHISLFHGLSPK